MTTIINEQGDSIGTVTLTLDENGNERFDTLSQVDGRGGQFFSLAGASHWLWLIDAHTRARAMRFRAL